jgi:hypothetical protein
MERSIFTGLGTLPLLKRTQILRPDVCKTAHCLFGVTLLDSKCAKVHRKVQPIPSTLSSTRGGFAMALQWGSEWQQGYVEALLETDAVNL